MTDLKGCGIYKKAGAVSTVASGAKSVVDFFTDQAKKTYDVWKGTTYAGYGVSLLSGLALALALAKITAPSGTAANAGRYATNETMKSSLAKSIRSRDRLAAEQALESEDMTHKRDMFLS